MRSHYSYFANFALRRYLTHPEKPLSFLTEAERQNWECARKVLIQLPQDSLDYLKEIFESRDTMADAIYEVAKKYAIDQNNLWTLLSTTEKKFAQERGLI